MCAIRHPTQLATAIQVVPALSIPQSPLRMVLESIPGVAVALAGQRTGAVLPAADADVVEL